MKILRLIILTLMTGLAAKAGAALGADVQVQPLSALQGQVLTVTLQVTNGSNPITGITPSLSVSAGTATLLSGPIPAAINLTASSQAGNFTYTYSVAACSNVSFVGSASGTENAAPVVSNQDSSSVVSVSCPTATPSATASPVVIPPTAIPGKGEAKILGNKFHAGAGKTVGFKSTLPYGGSYVISIYDRQGQKQKSIEREGIAGDNFEYWDGRSDQGSYLSTGIYAVHFRGKGLDKVAKIVVIK